MAIYKVKDDILIECKKTLLSYTDISSLTKVKNLGKFLIKRKRKAEKLIKLLEDEYYI